MSAAVICRFETSYGIADFHAALGALTRQPAGQIPMRFDPAALGMRSDTIFVPTLRGREALYVLLRSLSLNPGSGVGVPLYVCSCVPRVVYEAGFTPVFIDTDPDDFSPDLLDLAAKAHRMSAFVLVYTLGRPINVAAIRNVTAGKVLIEDCAQAIGSTYQGLAAGSLGEASFFTFGFFKPMPAGGGGLLALHDESVATRAKEIVSNSRTEGMRSQMHHGLACLARSMAFRNPAYSVLARVRAGMAEDKQSAPIDSKCIEDFLAMRPGDFAVIQKRLTRPGRSVDLDAMWNDLRASIPKEWHTPSEPAAGTWNHFIFAIRSPTPDRCSLALKRIRAAGISAARLFPNCRREMEPFGYSGECPKAERLSALTLTIPVHQGLSFSDRKRILKVIPEVLGTT